MSSPTQADTSRTPSTGTKRRYLGATRRKRTSDISLLSPAGTGASKQQRLKLNPTDHAGDCMLHHEKLCNSNTDVAKNELNVEDEISIARKRVSSGMHLQSENSLQKSNVNEAGSSPSPSPSSSSSLMSSSQSLQSTPVHRFPSMSRHSFRGSARKRFRHDDFKSPMRNPPDSSKATETVESVSKEVGMLQKTVKELESEIACLTNEGLCENELQTHIEKMHEYNELKDTGQMLLGKIALVQGVTTKDLYSRFGLGLDD